MSNPSENDFNYDVPEVPAEPEEPNSDDLVGEEVDDPTIAEEDK